MSKKELFEIFDKMILSFNSIKIIENNKLIMFISKDINYNNKKYKDIDVIKSPLISNNEIYLVRKESFYFE